MSDASTTRHEFLFRPTWKLASISIVGLGVVFLLTLGTFVGDAIRLYGTGIATDGIRNADLVEIGVLIRGLLALANLIVLFPLVVFFCFWTHRSATNARALGAGGFEHSPGWAVGWHFIPFANLWMPYVALSEVWRASRSHLPEHVPGLWQDSRSGFVLGAWWFTWLIGRTLDAIARPLSRGEAFAEALGSLLRVGGSTLEAIAALLCIVVIYRLTARQHFLADQNVTAH